VRGFGEIWGFGPDLLSLTISEENKFLGLDYEHTSIPVRQKLIAKHLYLE